MIYWFEVLAFTYSLGNYDIMLCISSFENIDNVDANLLLSSKTWGGYAKLKELTK
jgi:hypothetical protein